MPKATSQFTRGIIIAYQTLALSYKECLEVLEKIQAKSTEEVLCQLQAIRSMYQNQTKKFKKLWKSKQSYSKISLENSQFLKKFKDLKSNQKTVYFTSLKNVINNLKE